MAKIRYLTPLALFILAIVCFRIGILRFLSISVLQSTIPSGVGMMTIGIYLIILSGITSIRLKWHSPFPWTLFIAGIPTAFCFASYMEYFYIPFPWEGASGSFYDTNLETTIGNSGHVAWGAVAVIIGIVYSIVLVSWLRAIKNTTNKKMSNKLLRPSGK